MNPWEDRERGRLLAHRRALGKRFPSTMEELITLARNSDVPVTYCPPGIAAMGWVPSWMINR